MRRKLISDVKKFSFVEMTSNADGKTSSSGTMGILICLVGTICFLVGCIDNIFFTQKIDILAQSIIFTGIGAGLLGYRKSQDQYLIDETPLPEEELPSQTECTCGYQQQKDCTCKYPLNS